MTSLDNAKEKALNGEFKATNIIINAESIVKDEASDVDPIDAAENNAEDSSLTVWTEQPDGSQSFEADENTRFIRKAPGIYVEKRVKDEWTVPRRICGPLSVIATAVDRDSDNWMLKLDWMDARGVNHCKIISKGDLSEGKKVVRMLLDGGLDMEVVNSQNGNPDIVKYLLKHPVEKLLLSVDRTGWGDSGKWLILPDGKTIGTPDEEILFTGEMFTPFYESKGTLEEWQECVAKPATKSSRIAFSICAAFAPLFLRFVSACEGGFHFVGKSGCGKSSTLRAGVSVWSFGDHTRAGCEMGSWKATDVGVETFADRRSDWPMFLDELGSAKASEVKNLPALIYMLVNGQGKRRGNRALRAVRPMSWRAFFLSTGELTIEELAARQNVAVDAGVSVRLANIPAVPSNVKDGFCDFPGVGEGWLTIVGGISEAASRKCYGTAGPEFARRLIEYIEKDHGGVEKFQQELSNRVEEWVDKNVGSDAPNPVRRVARRCALVAQAGEIAIKLGVLPWEKETASKFVRICFDDWRREYEEAERDGDLLAVPVAIFRANTSRFSVAYEGTTDIAIEHEREPHIGFAILERAGGATTRLLLSSGSFDEEARKQGHSARDIARAFRDAGLLMVEKRDRKARLKTQFRRRLQWEGIPTDVSYYAFWMSPEAKEKYEKAR